MLFPRPTGAVRWLHIALAVLALVSTHANVVRIAFVTPCTRAVSPSMTAVDSAGEYGAAIHTAKHVGVADTQHDHPTSAPAEHAVLSACATGPGTLAAVVSLPDRVAVCDTVALLESYQLRPLSPAPHPPFRPPRTV